MVMISEIIIIIMLSIYVWVKYQYSCPLIAYRMVIQCLTEVSITDIQRRRVSAKGFIDEMTPSTFCLLRRTLVEQ